MRKYIPIKLVIFYILEGIITGMLFYWLFLLSRGVGNLTVKIEESNVTTTFFALGILAYLFGLRHALDADHLAAIDNSTRKLVQEKKPSHFTGLFFSLGHSSVVILLALTLIIATRYITSNIPSLEKIGDIIGTLISGGFLYIIGLLNFLSLLEIYNLYARTTREKTIDEKKLEEVLLSRGFMNKYFGKLFAIINSQYYMYPIGFLFGLGFDTASETALLAISAAAAGVFLKVPLWSLLVFPFLFTSGMTLIDTTDGFFMNGAYSWAFLGNPLKKIWYNLTMTTISILIAYLVGTLELLGLIQSQFNLSGIFWQWISTINGGVWWGNIGIIIIFTFALTWLFSYTAYRFKIKKYMKDSR
ncbi:MAG: HoxN/HupN/NixA family nickel/cobalt transporter [Saccharolobus sp.]|uniref:HoxN/HupN/NixA family nickel/cobalt transporter n=1 Tax=Saccharolobus TaxID=2100760 RepID=UPI001F0E32CB|nr:HoxN/HupN/NixA family nickel/cobalt transporter [Saccharolobus shibatae]MCH4815790.1 HoxN/HupN/NixA family nickel/cobalt transporter [Saccharolobus shibatae]